MSQTIPSRFLLFLSAALLVALGASVVEAQIIKGTARYRERIALPPGTVFEATLEDVSQADAPAQVLGSARLDPAGSPPFLFQITYHPARIKPERTYAVRARLIHQGRLLFTTDRLYRVLTGGHGHSVDLLLRRVSAPSAAPLLDTYWKLTQLDGAPVQVGFRQREPHLVLHSKNQRLAGSGGCNRLMGTYRLDRQDIAFGKVAATKMACPEVMQQEREFIEMLIRVRRWQIRGQQLDLFDAAGKRIARFQATYLRH